MAHTLQERYSSLVLAKLRTDLVLKDGVVFNNDYEGNPTSGAVNRYRSMCWILQHSNRKNPCRGCNIL